MQFLLRAILLCALAVANLSGTSSVGAQGGAPPGVPTNVQALVSANGATLTVSWNAPAGSTVVTAYRLDFRAANTIVHVAQIGPSTSVAIAIPAGVQGTFTVSVTAIANGVPGPSSNMIPFVLSGPIGPCAGPPSPPARLRFTRVGTLLTLMWDPVPGAEEYIVEVGSVTDGTDVFVGTAGLQTVLTTTIAENTHVYLRVRARNACGLSLRGDEIEIGAMWSVAFRPGLVIDPCFGPGFPGSAIGGLCSQVMTLRGNANQFDEIWSPGTPVMRATGTMTPTQFTATLTCLNGAASGTLQATWDGVRYVGTATFAGTTTNLRITPGNTDPQCEQPWVPQMTQMTSSRR